MLTFLVIAELHTQLSLPFFPAQNQEIEIITYQDSGNSLPSRADANRVT
jgi:hypothetical protein